MYKNKKYGLISRLNHTNKTNKYENYSKLFYVVHNNLALHDRKP